MTKKDLFYQDVEGRMEEMKQEKSTRGEKISKTFSFLIGFIILIGLLFTLIGLLR